MNNTAIDQLYSLFAKGEMPRELWTHTAHFVVATCLLFDSSVDEHLNRLRALIKQNNLYMGTENTDSGGYHETLTWFYLREIKSLLAEANVQDRYEAVRMVLQSPVVAKEYPAKFYGKELLFSVAARQSIIQPEVVMYT